MAVAHPAVVSNVAGLGTGIGYHDPVKAEIGIWLRQSRADHNFRSFIHLFGSNRLKWELLRPMTYSQ